MSTNALLFALAAGVLTFVIDRQLSSLLITNMLLGFIAGKYMDKRR